MQVKKIETDLAPKPQGFYSQAVQVGNLVFTSGQLPIVPDSEEIITGKSEKFCRQRLARVEIAVDRDFRASGNAGRREQSERFRKAFVAHSTTPG